jgi:hypothetical protein
MNRSDAVKTEVRKLASSKPVHAAAGAGALASAALRELPARISRWSSEMPGMASGYVTTARTKAVKEYDKLAVHGERVLHRRTALNGKNDSGPES